jgi:hypothetical protein
VTWKRTICKHSKKSTCSNMSCKFAHEDDGFMNLVPYRRPKPKMRQSLNRVLMKLMPVRFQNSMSCSSTSVNGAKGKTTIKTQASPKAQCFELLLVVFGFNVMNRLETWVLGARTAELFRLLKFPTPNKYIKQDFILSIFNDAFILLFTFPPSRV